MPSARDLLQQADALMRSHRNLGASNGQETVPVLTDVAVPGPAGVVTRQRVEEIPVLTNVVTDVDPPAFDLTIPVEPAPIPQRFPPTQLNPQLLPLSEMPTMPQFEENDSIIARRKSDSRMEKSLEPPAPIDDEMPKWLEADLLDSNPLEVPRSQANIGPAPSGKLDWGSLATPSVDALSVFAAPTERSEAIGERGGEFDVDEQAPLGDRIDEFDVPERRPVGVQQFAEAASIGAREEPSPASEDQEQPLMPSAATVEPMAEPALPRAEEFAEQAPQSAAEFADRPALPSAREFSEQPSPPGAREFAEQQSTPSTEELAETVYFQVLQNLDLYTERALQQHMTAHLSPIIERATQELLATLNANLGALMRQFVADAIEKQLGVRPATERQTSKP